MNKFNDLIDAKGVDKMSDLLTEALGYEVTVQRINNWKKRGVPHALVIEVAEAVNIPLDDLRRRAS